MHFSALWSVSYSLQGPFTVNIPYFWDAVMIVSRLGLDQLNHAEPNHAEQHHLNLLAESLQACDTSCQAHAMGAVWLKTVLR